MTYKEFRELQNKADSIGLITEIVQIGRGNYRKKKKNPDGSITTVVKETHYRRKYQVIVNGEIRKEYCRRVSAKDYIVDLYNIRLQIPNKREIEYQSTSV